MDEKKRLNKALQFSIQPSGDFIEFISFELPTCVPDRDGVYIHTKIVYLFNNNHDSLTKTSFYDSIHKVINCDRLTTIFCDIDFFSFEINLIVLHLDK